MQLLRRGVRVHLVGIGGIGMSAIARVLHGWNYSVSGSDREASALTEALAAEGVTIHIGHRVENLIGNDGGHEGDEVVVVISSAVPQDNPELVEARQRGFPVVKREQFLGALTAGKFVIAVAGTHGKTTTSAMIAWILIQAGLDPTFIVGGVLQNLGTNAQAGTGNILVIEADEYDRAFLGLWPDVAIVTTLEHDHPDCYPTVEEMRLAFVEFAGRARQRLIVCGEIVETRHLGEQISALTAQGSAGCDDRRVVFYGASPGWDWQADDLLLGASPTFKVSHGNKRLGTCALQLPGRHNVLNALAALAAAAEVGVDPGTAMAALTRFRGTARRFEVKGQAAGVTVVDDYAHHPTEIRATLAAARSKYPERSIWAVFQPHTFSRTVALLGDFAAAFGEADHLIVTPIYAAREADPSGVSGTDVVDRIRSNQGLGEASSQVRDAQYVDSLDGAVRNLLKGVEPGDVVITLGAGDGYRVGEQLLKELQRREQADRAMQGVSPQKQPVGSWGGSRIWTR